jgi:hypothetical protein
MRWMLTAVTLMVSSAAYGQQMLSAMPAPGTLPKGSTVYVDDGSCGAGRVARVTAGSNISGPGEKQTGSQLMVPCVTRPR